MEQIINTIVWGAIIQGLLLALWYMTSKKYKSKANILLGLFLLCFVFEALTMWIPFDTIGSYPIMAYFNLPEVKLFFPIFFFHYVSEKLGVSHQFQTFFKFHYSFAITVFAVSFLNFILFLFQRKTIHDFLSWDRISIFFMIQQYYAFFLTIIVLFISVMEIKRYQTKIKNEYSDVDMLNVTWLWQFVFAVMPIILMWGLELGRIAFGGRGTSDFILAAWFFVIVFIYFMSYRAFQQKNLLEGVPKPVNSKASHITDDSENNNHLEVLAVKIVVDMESNKYYLDQNLTIHDLSKSLNIPPRQLSACINNEMGLNFNEWVNNFRVDAVLELLKDVSKTHYSIEGIGEDAGFKSRSAMYTAFKKKTDHTPGYFRKL